ncbi:ankyrin repeat domain-containing protein 2-like [Bacillus rossius redtenbacheri]|uniref:ankyrin repeat domain-containing protein 2-like n=1 Tax=Bacillus rossius redtenbacheri TaxID=93214 RepID=UPI002FDDE8E7
MLGLILVFCAAHALALPKLDMDNYVHGPTITDGKLIKVMDYKFGEVKEDYQELKNELMNTKKMVEELQKEVFDLKMIIMDHDRQQGLDLDANASSVETEPQPSMRELVEQYDRSTDWSALRSGLEALLDERSVESRQLASVDDASWGHLWQVGDRGYEELATLLLDAGLPVDKRDSVGDAMLHGAAEGGRISMAQMLLERKADVNLRGWRGLTPFHKAALGGHPEALKWLADRGADVRSADDEGMTGLHLAAEHGRLEAARLLLDLGLDAAARDAAGRTPLDWALRRGHRAVAELLAGPARSGSTAPL